MPSTALETDVGLPRPDVDWVQRLPDGAVSIETDGQHWILRASQQLQSRFEDLLDRRKSGTISAQESMEYEAICDLDSLLSSFNRLARRIHQG